MRRPPAHTDHCWYWPRFQRQHMCLGSWKYLSQWRSKNTKIKPREQLCDMSSMQENAMKNKFCWWHLPVPLLTTFLWNVPVCESSGLFPMAAWHISRPRSWDCCAAACLVSLASLTRRSASVFSRFASSSALCRSVTSSMTMPDLK